MMSMWKKNVKLIDLTSTSIIFFSELKKNCLIERVLSKWKSSINKFTIKYDTFYEYNIGDGTLFFNISDVMQRQTYLISHKTFFEYYQSRFVYMLCFSIRDTIFFLLSLYIAMIYTAHVYTFCYILQRVRKLLFCFPFFFPFLNLFQI